MRVLGDRGYGRAAAMISVKLRARKRTPLQEAAGGQPRFWLGCFLCRAQCAMLLKLSGACVCAMQTG